MGLDSYFGRFVNGTLEEDEDIQWPEVNLTGGIMSGHGDGSFRGKVYEDMFAAMTGDTLYHAKQSSEWVQQMSIAMIKFTADEQRLELLTNEWHDKDHILGFVAMFACAAHNNLEYVGWW